MHLTKSLAGSVGLQVSSPASGRSHRHLLHPSRGGAHPLARPAQPGVPLPRLAPTAAPGGGQARLPAPVPQLRHQLPDVRPVQAVGGVGGAAAEARAPPDGEAGGGRVQVGCVGGVRVLGRLPGGGGGGTGSGAS